MKPIEKYSDNEEPGSKHTDRTPFVWAMQNGELTIKGRSVPDDIHQYLESILEWVDEYVRHPKPSTTLTINLEYLNGITSHYLYGIIRKLNSACNNFVVYWEYKAGDEDGLEQGQILASICRARFKFVRVQNGI